MRLNNLSPGKGAKKVGKRLGRGHSAGQGKTSGRGQKGQHARSGGYHKVGFEGGQMPLQRRLPKVGFNSRMARLTAELRLHELAIPTEDVIDMDVLKKLHLLLVLLLGRELRLVGLVFLDELADGLRVRQVDDVVLVSSLVSRDVLVGRVPPVAVHAEFVHHFLRVQELHEVVRRR